MYLIKNSIDFSYSIDKITSPVTPNIVQQGEILESDKINITFKEVEETLNTLYEKTRYLEDSIQYAKTFLETKNREFNEEMQSVIKELESLLDMSKNLAYISYNVPLKPNSIYINDRDSTFNNLSPLLLKDKALTLNYSVDTSHDFSSIQRIANSVPYDDNLSTVKTDKNYKVVYLEEKVVSNGLTETLVVYFPQPVVINILDFVTANCDVKNIRFGLINGIEEYASDYDLSSKNIARTCIYLKFDLVCTNYNVITYKVLKNKVTENLWNDIKEYEMSKAVSLNKNNKLDSEYIISRTTTNKVTGKTYTENFSDPSKVEAATTNLKLYSYIFSLDSFAFKNVELEKSGYFISDYINIGELTSLEYISLYVSEIKNDNACIEYSILDGEKEVPIVPLEHELIENEPIFNNAETRFKRDTNTTSKYYVEDIVKKDGQITDITFEDALTMNDGQYSITYKPSTNNYSYLPINKEIRIKAYIRTYDKNIVDIPYIDMITIRKFGEETLWTNKY